MAGQEGKGDLDNFSSDEFNEPEYQSESDEDVAPATQPVQAFSVPRTRPTQDPQGFLMFLKQHANPNSSWAEQQQVLVQHDEFDLVNADTREALFYQFAQSEAGSYLDLVKAEWQPSLYYPLFKRKFRSYGAFRDPNYTEKEREVLYREYTRLKKKSPAELANVKHNGTTTAKILAIL